MVTILLVEDESELARLIERELATNGYNVVVAPDGESAIARAESLQPDLIVLDWMLPGLNGLDVIRRVRESSPVPILMLTARREEMDRVIGLEVGADDYLTKPFGMRELVARVRALLRRIERVQHILQQDRQRQGQPVVYGGLQIDPDGYAASLHGQPVDLTRTEFDLLHLFVRNPGRAFSRAYLLDAVWGENYVSGDRSVDNAVLRLRRKLGSMGGAIETVWGIGYRLQTESEG